ncbi:MAG: hypothetical protein Q9170_003359 [Blastenia crenularia]
MRYGHILHVIESVSLTASHALYTVDVDSNVSSFGIPIQPQVLTAIQVALSVTQSQNIYNPTQLYFTLFITLAHFWKRPDIVPITETKYFRSLQYPPLDVVIEPASGSRLLTTAVAAAVLEAILLRLSSLALNPEINQCTLSTQRPPSIPIGLVRASFVAELDAERSGTIAASQNSVINESQTVSSGLIAIRLFLKGQTPGYPPITPRQWLNLFTGIGQNIFGNHISSNPISVNPRIPQVLYTRSTAATSRYSLTSELKSARVPIRRTPPT